MAKVYDYIVVGAGPAGVQLAYFLKKKKCSYIVLERAKAAGSFFSKFPIHRQLISINKVHTGYNDPELNMRWDWNSLICDDPKMRMTKYSKAYFPNPKYLVEYIKDFAKKFRLNIRYNNAVKRISKGDGFSVETASGEIYQARCVIVATGLFKPFIPDIPGVEYAENYVDLGRKKEKYQNKRVLIIGKGNSGFETADYLVDTASLIHLASPNPIKMAWRTHYVGHVRAINNNILDTYQLKSQNALINGYVDKISRRNGKYRVTIDYTFASGEVEDIEYDHVINCTGFHFDDSIFADDIKPKLTINGRFPAMRPDYECANVKDLYFAGVIMACRDYKKKQSGFIHGFRYNVKYLADYLLHKYQHRKMPSCKVSFTPSALTRKVITEVNHTSALWQQTGFLCDVILPDENKKSEARYYSGIPKDFVLKTDFAKHKDCFVITLEFGQKRIDRSKNVFAIERVHKDDSRRAEDSTGIHPIIRHYRNGKLVSEHHLIEDFESEWKEAVHSIPLHKYFAKEIVKMRKTKSLRKRTKRAVTA